MTEEASAALRYEQELLNKAANEHIVLTGAQREQIHGLANAMAVAEEATKKAKDAFDFVRDSLKGFLSDLRQGLQSGESFWTAFGNAAMNVIDKISSKIEDQLVDALMSALNTGGFNWTSLFGMASGGTVGGAGGIGHAASGGYVQGPGSGTSDTAGLFALSNGEYVVRAAMAKKYGPLLEAINDNSFVARRASGGWAGPDLPSRMSSIGTGSVPPSSTRSSTSVTVSPSYNITTSGTGGKSDAEQIKAVLREQNGYFKRIIEDVLVGDIENVGRITRANKARFGLNEMRGAS